MLAKPAPKGLEMLGLPEGVETGAEIFIILFVIFLIASVIFAFMYEGNAVGAIGHSLGSSFLSIFTSIGNGIILVIKAMISGIANKVLSPLENFFSHIKLPIGLLMEVHL